MILNNPNLPLTPLEIISSNCCYSGAPQSSNPVFNVHKGFTLITWDIVIKATTIELLDDEKCSSLKCMYCNFFFGAVIVKFIIVFITERK